MVGVGLPEAEAVNDTELPAHTALFVGLLVMAGGVLFVTVVPHVLEQPLVPVTVKFSVNEPEPPAVTLTDWPLLAPGIVPLPLTDQLYALIPAGAVYVLPVVLAHKLPAPVIEQVGRDFTVCVSAGELVLAAKFTSLL